jgi:hypothetical protein
MMPMLPDVVVAGTRGAGPHRAMGAMLAEDNGEKHALFCASRGLSQMKRFLVTYLAPASMIGD